MRIRVRKREGIWNGKNKCKKKIHVAKRLIGYVVKSNGKPFSMSSEITRMRRLERSKTWCIELVKL